MKTDFFDKYKLILGIFFLIIGFILFQINGYLFPQLDGISAYTLIALFGIGFFAGSQMLNIDKMKIEHTDWIVTEAGFETCTKIEEIGDWCKAYVGGYVDTYGFFGSSDGNKIYVFPKQALKKKGRVYLVYSLLEKCRLGFHSLPAVVRNTLPESDLKKICYLGFNANGLWVSKDTGEKVTTEYVATLEGNMSKQNELSATNFVTFENTMKYYSKMKNNLVIKK